jgi:CelD/BcsL family acetyltransferase involved in cellulose biosynthesis
MDRTVIDISVVEARTVKELGHHADAWDRLALAAPEQLPMLSYAWVTTFLENCIDARCTWRCLFAYEGDHLVGVLPLISTRGIFGTRLNAPFDPQTRSGHALLAAGREREALAAILDSVTSLEPRCISIRFHGIRSGSLTLLANRDTTARTATMPATAGRASVISTRGSFANYEKRLNTNFRRNLRKAHNRCLRDHESRFRVYAGPDVGPPHLLQQFFDVEASGWKGAAGTAIKCNPELVGFYSGLAQRLSDRGWLEWHFLDFDGEPVAGHFAIRFGRSLVLHKIGYDEKYARLGPGNLLFHHIVARAFADEGIDEINCLTDMPWHANWHVTKDEYSDMLLTPPRLLPYVVGKVEVELPAAALRRAKETAWLVKLVRRGRSVLARADGRQPPRGEAPH